MMNAYLKKVLPTIQVPVILLCVVVCYLTIVTFSFDIHREPWGDEWHFLRTVKLFGSENFFEIVRDYEEVTPPLVFILYALWGKVFGFETPALRVFSLLIAAAVHTLFGLILYKEVKQIKLMLLGLGVFLLNPYTIGLSLFVFTDMLMVFCILLLIYAVKQNNLSLLLIAAACGLLARQYFVFAVCGAILFYLLKKYVAYDKQSVGKILILLCAFIPLLILMLQWKGIAPPAGIARWNPFPTEIYHPSAFTLYVSLLFVFAFPVFIIQLRNFKYSLKTHGMLCIVSLIYFLMFPVQPSDVSIIQNKMETVGLFHKALVALAPYSSVVHLVFFMSFMAGVHIVYFLATNAIRNIFKRTIEFSSFLDFTIMVFLVGMPFSYQVWEKYFIPVLPILVLRLLLMQSEELSIKPSLQFTNN